MRSTAADALTGGRKALLAATAVVAVGLPVTIGVLTARPYAAARQITQTEVRVNPGPREMPAEAVPADLRFEVASVKPNTAGENRVMIGNQPGGRYTATNAGLRLLIRTAYQLQDFQIVNAPDWVNDERFDISARAEGDVRPAPIGVAGPMQIMVRNLLADRFKLVVH